MKQAFQVTDEFRAMMREVASKLDWNDDRTALLGPRAIVHDCGYGGRIEGDDAYRFTYFDRDGHGRWEVTLREHEIRDLAAGRIDELDGDQLAPNTHVSRGEPLLVWGEYDEDALTIRTPGDLAIALDVLHSIGMSEPLAFRLWSSADAQIVAVLNQHECALYVVHNEDGYGTSVGDPTRTDSFELVDHDLGALAVPWSDCVPWRVARLALLRFAERGELGDHVILDGRIPSSLLMIGDFDRSAELASRKPPTAELARTSLPRKASYGAWAERLLDGLVDLQLIEIDSSIAAEIAARLAILLARSGEAAQDTLEVANELAKDLARLRGVGALFATGGDLQIALRRTQDPPTMPVEMPLP